MSDAFTLLAYKPDQIQEYSARAQARSRHAATQTEAVHSREMAIQTLDTVAATEVAELTHEVYALRRRFDCQIPAKDLHRYIRK